MRFAALVIFVASFGRHICADQSPQLVGAATSSRAYLPPENAPLALQATAQHEVKYEPHESSFGATEHHSRKDDCYEKDDCHHEHHKKQAHSHDHNNHHHDHQHEHEHPKSYDDHDHSEHHDHHDHDKHDRHNHEYHKHDHHYKISKPKGIPDPPLQSYQRSNLDISSQNELRSELFTAAEDNEERRQQYYHQNRFNTYSNAPNSVFHTQLNVDSPGGQFNVANNFPRGTVLGAAASEMDVVMAPPNASDLPKDSRLLEVIYTPESSKTVKTAVAAPKHDSELHDDGYHYERPSVSFDF